MVGWDGLYHTYELMRFSLFFFLLVFTFFLFFDFMGRLRASFMVSGCITIDLISLAFLFPVVSIPISHFALSQRGCL